MPDAYYDKLAGCFTQVFPDLSPSAISEASQDSVSGWDSIAQITLLSLIGEEFGMEIDFEEFENVASFHAILEIVRGKAPNGHA
jgi:acyl carrier protein